MRDPSLERAGAVELVPVRSEEDELRDVACATVIDAVERQGGRVVSLEVAQEGDRRSVAVDVELRVGSAPAVVAGVAEIDGVLEVRWTD